MRAYMSVNPQLFNAKKVVANWKKWQRKNAFRNTTRIVKFTRFAEVANFKTNQVYYCVNAPDPALSCICVKSQTDRHPWPKKENEHEIPYNINIAHYLVPIFYLYSLFEVAYVIRSARSSAAIFCYWNYIRKNIDSLLQSSRNGWFELIAFRARWARCLLCFVHCMWTRHPIHTYLSYMNRLYIDDPTPVLLVNHWLINTHSLIRASIDKFYCHRKCDCSSAFWMSRRKITALNQ